MDIKKLRALGINDPTVIRILAQREADRSVSEQQQPQAVAATTPAQQSQQQPAPQAAAEQAIPALTPEDKESLLGAVGRKALSGLQWVGESLDKPGRAVRGVLGGEFNEIFDIIPFSDTLGLTTPEDDVSGRQLLETYGLLGENKPGLDLGDVAGLGVEIATDPLGWVSTGGAKVASKVLSEGADMAKAVTPAAKAAEIEQGARSLLTIHTPSLGVPFMDKIPFTDIKTPRLESKVLKEVGTGPAAAGLYRAVNYGKFSPNPYVRKLFSALPEVNELPVRQQEMADKLAEARIASMDQAGADAVSMFGNELKAQEALSSLADSQFFGGPNGKLRLVADAVNTVAKDSAEVQSLLKSRLGTTSIDLAGATEETLKKVSSVYNDILRNKKQYGELANDLKQREEELLSAVFEQANIKDPFHSKWFDDSIRQFVESKDGLGIAGVADAMKAAGFSDTTQGFDAAAEAMYNLADNMRGLYKNMQKELKNLGVDVDDLNDYYVGYSHRRPQAKEGSALFNYLKRRLVKTDGAPFMIARDDVLRNIPLGTRAINEMTRDPLFTAIKHNKQAAAAEWKQQLDIHAPELSTRPEPGTYLESVWNAAREQGLSYQGLQSFARDVRKEELEALKAVNTERKRIFQSASSIDPDWRKNVNAVLKANGDYTSVPGFDEMVEMTGLDHDSLWKEMSTWNVKQAKKSGEQVAQEALERYRSAAQYADQGDGAIDFDPNMFDVTKDKTGLPDPSFGSGSPKYTRDNAAFLLAHKYNLPAWWNYDKLQRAKIAEGQDAALAALAKDGSLSDHQFNEAWWKEMKQRQATLPPEQQWAAQAGDVDDFTVLARENIPELGAIPVMSQSDLHDLVNKLYHMPKEVLDEGLFNRGTTTDAVDYLMHATRLKAGVSSMRSILRSPGVLKVGKAGEKVEGLPIADAWREAGLTDDGLMSFGRELFGDGLADDVVAAKLATTSVDPEVAGIMTRYISGFKDPENVSELFKWVDSMNGLFKGTLTIPYPAFHTRNRISGLFANWASGVYDGKAEKEAQDLFFGRSSAADAEELLNEIKAMNVVSIGRGGAESQVFDRLEQFRGVGESDMPIGISDSNAKNTARYILNPFGELVEDTRQAYQEGGLKGAAKQVFTGGRRADGSSVTDLNPFGMKGVYDPLGKKNRADRVDAFGKPLKGADAATSYETTNAVYKAGANANDYIEWMNRVGPYIALRRAGWNPALAARKVRQVQFDYRELSPFERRIMKRVIPFYSFMRKNLEQQSRLLLQNPGGRTAQMIRTENNAAKEGKGKGGYVPKYLAESFALRLPGGNDREATYFSQSGLLPFEEAFNRFSFDDGVMPLNVKRTGEKLLAQSNPVIQGPLEFITGRQFWSGRNIDDLYQSPTSDQDINLMVSKLPISRAVNTIGGVFDDRKSIPEKLFNLTVGGAKFTDVDPAKQRALEARDILEMSLASDPDIGKYTGIYASDMENLIARYQAGDQEAAKMLKLYQEIAKELRAMKKQQPAA